MSTQENTAIKQPTSMEIIYELQGLRQVFEDKLEASEGELTEAIEIIEQQMLSVQEEAKDKVERIYHFTNTIDEILAPVDGQIAYYKQRIEAANNRKKSLTKLRERMLYLIGKLMKELELKQLDTAAGQVKIRNSERLEILDETLALKNVPEEFVKIKKSIDKTPLKAYLKNTGIHIDGVSVSVHANVSLK